MSNEEIEIKLEKIRDYIHEHADVQLREIATLDALRQGLQEVCARLGTDGEQFSQRFQAAYRWHYGRLLETTSDSAPNLAALLDTRPIEQVPTSEQSPRILREDPP
jgi:hypothetical protein